jgi:hypothetical protein
MTERIQTNDEVWDSLQQGWGILVPKAIRARFEYDARLIQHKAGNNENLGSLRSALSEAIDSKRSPEAGNTLQDEKRAGNKAAKLKEGDLNDAMRPVAFNLSPIVGRLLAERYDRMINAIRGVFAELTQGVKYTGLEITGPLRLFNIESKLSALQSGEFEELADMASEILVDDLMELSYIWGPQRVGKLLALFRREDTVSSGVLHYFEPTSGLEPGQSKTFKFETTSSNKSGAFFLDCIAEICAYLTEDGSWETDESLPFILFGLPGVVFPINIRNQRRHDFPGLSRIVLEILPTTPEDQVRMAFAEAKKSLVGDPKGIQKVSDKKMEVASFVFGRLYSPTRDSDRIDWKAAMTEWNDAASPEDRYEYPSRFSADVMAGYRFLAMPDLFAE